MVQAVWQGTVIAESTQTQVVEGNHYFPADSVDRRYLVESAHTSHCGWKGQAHYYHVEVDGQRNDNAAWFYPEPLPDASEIRGYVAFWRGVQVA